MANTTNIQKLIPISLILGLETLDSKFFIGQFSGYDMNSDCSYLRYRRAERGIVAIFNQLTDWSRIVERFF
jgi:hypothetical protein